MTNFWRLNALDQPRATFLSSDSNAQARQYVSDTVRFMCVIEDHPDRVSLGVGQQIGFVSGFWLGMLLKRLLGNSEGIACDGRGVTVSCRADKLHSIVARRDEVGWHVEDHDTLGVDGFLCEFRLSR